MLAPSTCVRSLWPRLLSCLTYLPGGAACGLSRAACHLSCGLPELLPKPADSLADAPERLAGASGKLADRTARPERLPGRISQPPERLARGATRLSSLLCRLADIVQRLAHGTTRTKSLLPYVADAADRVVDRLDQALENLRVAIERRQCPVEDVVQILEPHLELRLSLDTGDVHLDFAEVDVDARDDLEKVPKLRAQRQMRLQLLDVDVDLVNLDFLDVDIDIGIVLGARPSSCAVLDWLARADERLPFALLPFRLVLLEPLLVLRRGGDIPCSPSLSRLPRHPRNGDSTNHDTLRRRCARPGLGGPSADSPLSEGIRRRLKMSIARFCQSQDVDVESNEFRRRCVRNRYSSWR